MVAAFHLVVVHPGAAHIEKVGEFLSALLPGESVALFVVPSDTAVHTKPERLHGLLGDDINDASIGIGTIKR